MGFLLRQLEAIFIVAKLQLRGLDGKIAVDRSSYSDGQNSKGEKADKASCFAQLYVTTVFSGTSPWSVFRDQSVLNQLSFCNKGGIPDMQGLFSHHSLEMVY